MIGDRTGYRFNPANVTIEVGDGIRFISVSGAPHNVAFSGGDPTSLGQLAANMPTGTEAGPSAKIDLLSGPLLVSPNDTYTVSFGKVRPGVYEFRCVPHQALGMKGVITVR